MATVTCDECGVEFEDSPEAHVELHLPSEHWNREVRTLCDKCFYALEWDEFGPIDPRYDPEWVTVFEDVDGNTYHVVTSAPDEGNAEETATDWWIDKHYDVELQRQSQTIKLQW